LQLLGDILVRLAVFCCLFSSRPLDCSRHGAVLGVLLLGPAMSPHSGISAVTISWWWWGMFAGCSPGAAGPLLADVLSADVLVDFGG
jgi:hypothetical protein